MVPLIAILSILFCYILRENSLDWFNYKFGWELLLVNGIFTFTALFISSKGEKKTIEYKPV
jgi:hypothetical protein